MLLDGDGPLLPVKDRGPLALGDDGSRKPVHIDSEVVKPPQMKIGRNPAGLEHSEKILGRGLN